MLAYPLDLAVLPFLQRKQKPCIAALPALDLCLDRSVTQAADFYALRERSQCPLIDHAMGTHPVAPGPACRRQLELSLECAVICEKQKPFAVKIKPPDGNDARKIL